jgi:hypothetical protein
VRHPDNGVGIDLAVALVLHESAAVLPGLLESLDAGLAGVPSGVARGTATGVVPVTSRPVLRNTP